VHRPSWFCIYIHVENLLIENLSFTNCTFPCDWSIAVFITDVANLTISRIVVQNTTGYGMVGMALKGNISIFELAFLYNHGDENHVGDNVILLLDSCSSPGNNTAVSLNIVLVHLLSFMETFHVFPTGLTVGFLDNNTDFVYQHLDKVTFSHNKNGDLWLVFVLLILILKVLVLLLRTVELKVGWQWRVEVVF